MLVAMVASEIDAVEQTMPIMTVPDEATEDNDGGKAQKRVIRQEKFNNVQVNQNILNQLSIFFMPFIIQSTLLYCITVSSVILIYLYVGNISGHGVAELCIPKKSIVNAVESYPNERKSTKNRLPYTFRR